MTKLSEPILEAIAVTAELTGTQFTKAGARVFAQDLAAYPEPLVLAALRRCRREVKGKLSLQDVIGRLDTKTGKVLEYPFPQSENTMREFFLDSQGRMWFATPTNNKVGYFFLAGGTERASK